MLLLFMILVAGCREQKREMNTSELSAQIDSLRMEVRALHNQKDTLHDTVVTVKQTKPPVSTMKVTPVTTRSIPETKPVEIKKREGQSDTIFYYYNSPPRNVSAKITPWLNGRRQIVLYNPSGIVTYTIEDTKLSYTNISEISGRHPNGAIAEISQHLNPGASMYMYRSVITFDTDNSPLWRSDTKEPETLEEQMHSKSYWDKKTQSWKKQEIARESPMPGLK